MTKSTLTNQVGQIKGLVQDGFNQTKLIKLIWSCYSDLVDMFNLMSIKVITSINKVDYIKLIGSSWSDQVNHTKLIRQNLIECSNDKIKLMSFVNLITHL